MSILWFRHGLRFHDNPALLKALETGGSFYPVYIFDGETSGTATIGFNRLQYLLESLQDLDNQLRQHGGRLFIFRGSPVEIFKKFWEELGVSRICFEQDCEPIWQKRDNSVKLFCKQYGIECIECVSHTLWNPHEVIEANGGCPPLTYQMFLHTTSTIGEPSRPVKDPYWPEVNFGRIPHSLPILEGLPTPAELGVYPDDLQSEKMIRWVGGETEALKYLEKRLKIEEGAFREGYYLPNQANPDLNGPPLSLSPALRHGCLSVRRFYWDIHDLYTRINLNLLPSGPFITGQLIWREYFYTMSVNNPFYGEMERNMICLNVPWKRSDEHLERWKKGQTGFPFIDAVMRQLLLEGWVHHVARNAVACFLTRGDLWISWEEGLSHFLKYLLDADWSVCAGCGSLPLRSSNFYRVPNVSVQCPLEDGWIPPVNILLDTFRS